MTCTASSKHQVQVDSFLRNEQIRSYVQNDLYGLSCLESTCFFVDIVNT